MDETIRRDNSGDTYSHPTSKRVDNDRGDDLLLLFRPRDQKRPSLTKREREERWPIG